MGLDDAGDGFDIRQDAGHVRGGGQRDDDATGALQRAVQVVKVGAACRRFAQFDDFGPGFPPWQDVRVMLVWPDHDAGSRPDAQKGDQPVQPRCGPRSGEDHRMLGPCPAGRGDGLTRLTPQACDMGAAMGSLGMAVGVEGKDIAQNELLDLPQRATRGDVIGVDEFLATKGRVEFRPLADEAMGNALRRTKAVAEALHLAGETVGHGGLLLLA